MATMKTKKTSIEMTGETFEAWRVKALAAVDETLRTALDRGRPDLPAVERLFEAMSYALLEGGKRVRPLLALAAAEAVGGKMRQALPAAAAIEMIHAYSLIHDDLPAMDNDDLRRGRPTCHKVYGEATAILAGDALLTLAFETLARPAAGSGAAAAPAARALLVLARGAGGLGMVGGQALDLSFERRPGEGGETGEITGEMVRAMEHKKTGELIAGALEAGAVLGGATPAASRRMRGLGLDLGLAFQIKDDLLNLHGNPAVLGKAVGSDQARGKASFPQVMGVEAAEREFAGLSGRALATAASFPGRVGPLGKIIESLVSRQA